MKNMTKVIAILATACLGRAGLAYGQIICELAPGVDPLLVGKIFAINLVDGAPGTQFYLYDVPGSRDPHIVEQYMSITAWVVWAEDNDVLDMPEHHGASKGSTIGAVGDPSALYALNSGLLAQIRWDESRANRGTRPVRVAILDTGLSPYHDRIWEKVVGWTNIIEPKEMPYDIPRGHDTDGDRNYDEGVGHGSMVTGVVAMIAPNCELLIARVADSDGVATAWGVIKGLAFAAVNGAEVANVSLGSVDRIPALSEVLHWTEARGLLIISPIGNNGARLALFPSGYSKVACITGVLPDDRKAPFSNWEGTADAAAPATGIKSLWWDGTLGIWSGTSFAAPLVAGSVAAALQNTNWVTPENLRNHIEEGGDDIDPLNPLYRGELGMRLNFTKLFDRIGAG